MEGSRSSYIIRTSVSIAAGLLRVAASLAFVWVSKALVDAATGTAAAAAAAATGTGTAADSPFGRLVCLMAAVMLLQVLLGSFASYWENLNITKTTITLRRKAFERVLRSTWQGRERYASGDVTSRLHEDVRVVVDLLCTRIPDIVITLCQLTAASIYLMTMEPGLVWLLVGFMAVAVVGSKMFFRTLRRLTDHIRRSEAQAQQHIQESALGRILVLTLFGVEKVLEKLDIVQKDILDTSVKRLNYNAVARTFMSLGFAAGYAAAFFWGVFGIRDGSVTYGMMTAFLQLVGQVQRPVADLGRHIPAIIRSLTSRRRLKEILEMPQEEAAEPLMLEAAPSIRLAHLGFAYEDRRPIIRDLSFEFPAGKFTAVAGPTGQGKSTLIRLLMSVLSPSEGTVTLCCGGREIPASSATRCNFMYVPQGNTLVSGTIRENLLMVAPGASDAQMREALHTAAADFVFELPEGLDTVCGEVGSGLSEGQAQRISIARALLHPGTVLILDEATSALDEATEQILLERLADSCRERRTVIFVSHRGTVFNRADKILSLE